VTLNVSNRVELASKQQHWDGMYELCWDCDFILRLTVSSCQQTKTMFSMSQVICFRLSRKQQIWHRNVKGQAGSRLN